MAVMAQGRWQWHFSRKQLNSYGACVILTKFT